MMDTVPVPLKNVKIVIVEPCYQINLGYMARVMKNFGIDRMHLVNPRVKYCGKEAIKFSKHAADILKNARTYRSIKEATKDCDIVLGTTGLWHKSDGSFFNVFSPKKALDLVAKGRKVAILIGRDDTGLSKEELRACDASIFIPTSKEYPILNISHALAIILYQLSDNGFEKQYPLQHLYASKGSQEAVINLFSRNIEGRSDIRDKESVLMAFKHIITRSNATKKELRAISIGIAPRNRDKKQKK